MMALKEGDDDADVLKNLQRENEDRWDQLQELHQQCVHLLSLKTPSSDTTAATFLQAEREVLVEYSATNREYNELLDELEDRHSGEDRFGAELVDRCNQLHELELLFREKMRFQNERMEKIEHSIQEQVMIRKKLRQFRDQLNRVHDPENTAADQQENERLRGDLAYLAGLVAPTETMNATERQTAWSLNELMIHLLERHMSSPDEPYLSCRDGNIRKEHVEILKNSWLVETFDHDDNMIRLTDYTQEE